MSRVLFVPEGPPAWASSRLRAYWICEAWDEAEIGKGELSLDGVEVLVIQEKVMREGMRDVVTFAKEEGIKIVHDACDPMFWWMHTAAELIEAADVVVTSTDALAGAVRQAFRKPAVCIPDRHRVDAYTVKEHADTPCPILMWHGVFLNRGSLYNCMSEVARLIAHGVEFKIVIVDNEPTVPAAMLEWTEPPPVIEYVQWDLDTFYTEVLPTADVGLVPPFPGRWGHFKSDNKQIAFHLAGIPAVTGMELGPLVELMDRWELRKEYGAQLRKKAMESHAIERSVEEWRKLVSAIT